MFAAANVWHYWIAVVLMFTMIVPACAALGIMYVKKVSSLRYPSPDQEQG